MKKQQVIIAGLAMLLTCAAGCASRAGRKQQRAAVKDATAGALIAGTSERWRLG